MTDIATLQTAVHSRYYLNASVMNRRLQSYPLLTSYAAYRPTALLLFLKSWIRAV